MRKLNEIDFSAMFRSPLEKILYYTFCDFCLYPDLNAPLFGYEVDFLFKDKKLCVEVDGKEFHNSAIDREKDAKRQKNLEKKGYSFYRMDGWFCYRHPEIAVCEIILKYFADDVDKMIYTLALSKLGRYLIDFDVNAEAGRVLIEKSLKD